MKCPSVCALPRGSHISLNWPSQARWLQTVFCMRATHPQRTKFPSVGPSGSYGFTVELAAGSAPPAKASCHGLARTPVKNYTSSSRDPPGMTPGPRESILAVWRAPRGSGERTEDPETRSSTRWTTELLGLTSDLHVQLRTRVLLDPVKIRRKNLYSNSRDTSCREAGVSMVV